MGSITATDRANVWRCFVNLPKDPVTGRRRQETFIHKGGKRSAREAMEARQTAVRLTATPVATRAAYADLHAKYMAHAQSSGQAGNTLRQKHSVFTLYLEPAIGDIPLADLTVVDLDDLYHQLLSPPKPLGTSYVKQVHTQLKSTLDKGVAWGWVPANVARLTKAPRIPTRPVTSPSTDAVRRVLAHLQTHADPMLHLFAETIATTGMRPGEVCAISWDRFDFDTGILTVDRAISRYDAPIVKATKTGNMRKIHLPAELLAAYKAIYPGDGNPFVFTLSDGKPWRPDQTANYLRVYAREVGHGEVTCRALRHYVATQLISSGVDPVTVARILGHASPAMTLNVYAAYVPANGGDALAALREARHRLPRPPNPAPTPPEPEPARNPEDAWNEWGRCVECEGMKGEAHAWSCSWEGEA